MAESLDKLYALAAALGVQTSYVDQAGNRQEASREALLAVFAALGVEGEPGRQLRRLKQERAERLLEPAVVLWNGRGGIRLRKASRARVDCVLQLLESGEVMEWGEDAGVEVLHPPRRVSTGRHRLHVKAGRREFHAVVLAAPRQLPRLEERALGVFAPLYALHSQRSWGIGDLRDLRELDRWAGGLGCRYVGTLPMLACFLDQQVFEPSPYAPVSRLFWNELFLDVEEVARLVGAGEQGAPRPELSMTGWVDYRGAARAKQRALADLAARGWESDLLRAEMEAFMGERPEGPSYACFRAEVEARGATWQRWPRREREGGLLKAMNGRARYHAFVQYVLHRQLMQAAREASTGLYLDLPIGVHGGGYDVWRHQELFAMDASVGAPPDQLFEGGQNWGFPPLHPHRCREDGHAYFAACLRNHLQYAKVLRIDHVMGLHRSFWIPRGMETREGVYVQYPAEELIAVLSIEAHRAGACIVGENLGTVPEEVNEAMERHRIMGMFVGQFAFTQRPEAPMAQAGSGNLASLNTHDTATLAGFLAGRDIDERERMGLLDDGAAAAERAGRRALVKSLVGYAKQRGVTRGKPAARVLAALLRDLAASEAEIVLVTLEDLWLEQEPQNIPGTTSEYPCWRRQAALSLEEITGNKAIAELLRELVELRQARSGGRGARVDQGRTAAKGGRGRGRARQGAEP